MRAPLIFTTATALLLAPLAALPQAPAAAAPAPPAAAAPAPPGGAEARGVALAAERAARTPVAFGRCPDEEGLPRSLECGTVRVPLDYAAPDGKQIDLTVSRVRAAGPARERQGALVFNPGGPGASGMLFPLVGIFPEWKRLGSVYDLVGYAPRGVGRSAPLSCRDPREKPDGTWQAPEHPTEEQKAERIAVAKAYARGCAERSGERLRHVTSLNNARDLEVLRAGLGERKLTFMGASYGTYFGALYATLFPSHVRRMVFDSAVDPTPSRVWYGNNLAQSAAFEERWADFRRWIASHDAVYGMGSDGAQVLAGYRRAREKLAAEPAGGRVGPAQLQAVMLRAGYYEDYWPSHAGALAAYLKGDPQPLVNLATPLEEGAAEAENARAVYTAVECNDAPWPTRWETWDRDHTRLARRAPFETWENAWLNLPCAYWKEPRQSPLDVRVRPGELPGTLILAGERDAATPYAGALELRRRLPGASLVTERGAGTHGLAGGPNACVNQHVEAYLIDGKLPGRSTDCAARPAPEPQDASSPAGDEADGNGGRALRPALPRAGLLLTTV
ncbi:alpha/beta hydrolase, partial [Streptomyces diastaticus]|uniref:alpha/beta hydrolase n=1 Tax=Streptomyces diastaticus TaxID=1956 RepID=UPI0036699F9A